MLVKVIVMAVGLGLASANYLQMSYSSGTDCQNEVANNFLKTDKCISVPSNPSSSHKLLVTSMVLSCEQKGDDVSLGMTLYSASSCGGVSQDFATSFSTACSGYSTFTCVPDITSSTAVTQKWPAIGAYSGDDTCTNVDTLTSSADGECVPGYGGADGWSVKVSNTDGNINGEFFVNSTTCTNRSVSFSAPVGKCSAANNAPNDVMHAHAIRSLFVKLGLPAEGPILSGENSESVKASDGVQLFYSGNSADLMPLTPPI